MSGRFPFLCVTFVWCFTLSVLIHRHLRFFSVSCRVAAGGSVFNSYLRVCWLYLFYHLSVNTLYTLVPMLSKLCLNLIADETVAKINDVMQNFKGTHNFHNFTSRR